MGLVPGSIALFWLLPDYDHHPAVLALIVVKALAESSVGVFTCPSDRA